MKDSELLVTWRSFTGRTHPVGWLTYNGVTFTFEYTDRVREIPDFRPLVGFANFDVIHASAELFPLFMTRIMSPRRPDFVRYLSKLGLDADATVWEQLVASRGRREGDTIEVMPLDRASL
jgi:hypothetical protein